MARATEDSSIAIGSCDDSTGNYAIAQGYYSIAIGSGASTSDTSIDGISIGRNASTYGPYGIAIGPGASASANQIQLGNSSTRYDLKVGNGMSSTVQAGGYKIGSNVVIDSDRNITGDVVNADTVETMLVSVNGKTAEIGVDGVIKGTSYKINDSVVIDRSRNITGTSYNLGDAQYITNYGVINPTCINFFNLSNIAFKYESGKLVPVTLDAESGTSTGHLEFGISTNSNITSSYTSGILLVVVTLSRTSGSDQFNTEVSGIITNTTYHGDLIFKPYIGSGVGIGSEWGTIRVTYYGESVYSQANSLRQMYISYSQKEGNSTNISVKIFRPAVFN